MQDRPDIHPQHPDAAPVASLADRRRARAQATAGVEYVRRVHDGQRSAQVLSTFLS